MDKKHRGALSEMAAISYLLERGYDVFRNVSQHGLADIVAVDFAERAIHMIDVKTSYQENGGVMLNKKRLSPEQRQLNISLMQVTRSGGIWWDHVALPDKHF